MGKPGTNVSMKVHVVDPKTGKAMKIPHAAFTFFDLDTGIDNNHSVEYLRVKGHAKYFVSNETEINVTHTSDGYTVFKATKEGTGADNPSDPTKLTVLQKNRAVTFLYEDLEEIEFEAGATEGQRPRVFSFVFRPSLLCAYTKMKDDKVLTATSKDSPIEPVPGGSHRHQSTAFLIGLLMF